MKITRRSDTGKGGHLLISVPAKQVAEVEEALTFLEGKRQKQASQVVITLIVTAARRNGWHHTRQARSGLPMLRRATPEPAESLSAVEVEW